jgi:hypothetical protein
VSGAQGSPPEPSRDDLWLWLRSTEARLERAKAKLAADERELAQLPRRTRRTREGARAVGIVEQERDVVAVLEQTVARCREALEAT